jgi:hypothetical protein
MICGSELELILLLMHLTSIKAFVKDFLKLRINSFSCKNSERKNKPGNWELYLMLSKIVDIIHTRHKSIGVTYQL